MSLAIIQARLHSTRLPNKMLLPLGDTTVLGYACRTAYEFFDDVIVAVPAGDYERLCEVLPDHANVFPYVGDEADVLGRFHVVANRYREDPEDIIYRLTPDDFPLDLLRERFTLAQLDEWHATVTDPHLREHIGLLIPQRIEINTEEDYRAALARLNGQS